MIVLDTNVISEAFRPAPDAGVLAWLESLGGEVAITAITLAEILAGVRRLPPGHRKDVLTGAIQAALQPYTATRAILAFDEDAADSYAEVLAARERVGQPISTADAQIAAICRSVGAALATRNVKDFEHCGVDLIDPWHRSS